MLGHMMVNPFPVWAGLELIPVQTGKGIKTMKCTQIVKFICLLIAEFWGGRTCNSSLIKSCMSFLYGGQLSTETLVLQFVFIFIASFPAWAGIIINSTQNKKWN